MAIDILLSTLLALLVAASVLIIVSTIGNGVPPMPTSRRVRAEILAALDAIAPRGTIVELGCGWGTLVFALSRRFPAATVIGYENSFVPFFYSLTGRFLRRIVGRGRNVNVRRKDFFKVSLRDADIVVCYLSPDCMRRLGQKLTSELKKSATVVSSTFALPDRLPARTTRAGDIYGTKIYLYRGPEAAKIDSPDKATGTMIDFTH